MASRIRRQRLALLALVIVVLSACAGLAYATLGRSATAQTGQWAWSPGAVVPGQSVALDATIREMLAMSSGIDASSVRQVASVGQGERRNQLLAAVNASGTMCVAQRASSFVCLDDRYDPYAVVVFPIIGGSTLSVIDRASVVGIARSDVAQIELSFKDGTTIQITPDKSRAFTYVADGAASVPTELHAYDSGGKELETVDLSVSPPGPTVAGG